ncbi:uncharacterized protein [Primulina huaijiensis]|uniref:uncharacterized protein n=1 Tax=Primulina huaijiensis TaxID=1492673 RepID=UPI003CC785FA
MPTTRFVMSISRFCSTFHTSKLLCSLCNLYGRQTISGTPSLGYRYLSNYTRSQKYDRRNFSMITGVPAGAPSPPPPSSSNFSSNWILGIALSVVLPVAANKCGPFLKFKKEVDDTVEIVEEIAEVVEKVADVVDKVAEDISGDLPNGGKLKKVVDIVEDVAEKTAKDAHIVGDAIKKFQEGEGEVETIVQTLVGYQKGHKKEAKNDGS